MPLKMLLERFVRGLPLPSASGYGEAQYYGDDEDYMIDPRTLDLAEKEQLIREQKLNVYGIQERLKQEQAEEQRLKDESAAASKQNTTADTKAA